MRPEDLRPLVTAGLSDTEIADKLGVTARTVLRWRKRAGLPSMWTPTVQPCGTLGAYARGCRCVDCRRAKAERIRRTVAAYQGMTRRAGRAYEPWSAEDDHTVLDASLTVVERARRLQRTYQACTQRITLLRRRQAA